MKLSHLRILLILAVLAAMFTACKDNKKPEQPEDTTAMKFLTQANKEFELNNFESAITNYKKALTMLKYKNNRDGAKKYLNQSYIQLARKSFNNADWKGAIKYYDKAIEQKDFNMSNSLKSNLLVEKGLCLHQLRRFFHALERYREALKLTPKGKKIHFYMANAYMSRRQFDLAVAEYKKEIEINPSLAEAYNNCGSAFVALNQNTEAIKYFEAALAKNANYYKAYQNLSSAYSNVGAFGKAIKTYKRLLEKNPRMKEAYVYMAEIYMIIRDQTRARNYLRVALEKGYNNWNYLLNYSRGLRKAKEYAWFKKLIKKYKK